MRAIEAAAKSIISPENDVTTVGTLIRDISAKPSKWDFKLPHGSSGDPVNLILGLMRLVWKSQFDRHGTDDETIPLNVSQEEAETALHVAGFLVHQFSSGAISVKVQS
jgi:hypothetical protein